MDKKYNVLVVEDEERILQGIKNILICNVEEIAHVYTASNGKVALELIDEIVPDFMFTDVKMPEMDGRDFVAAVRKKGIDVPIIVLSALADFEVARQMMSNAAQNYLLKPFDADDIITEANKAIVTLKQKQKVHLMQKIEDDNPDFFDKTLAAAGNDLIVKACKYIHENVSTQISLNDVAMYLHLNNSYLSNLFKKELNQNMSEYITDTKMKHAKKLLLETNLSVTEIYEKVGYQSDKYFIKVFKERENSTPNQFRKTYWSHIN